MQVRSSDDATPMAVTYHGHVAMEHHVRDIPTFSVDWFFPRHLYMRYGEYIALSGDLIAMVAIRVEFLLKGIHS